MFKTTEKIAILAIAGIMFLAIFGLIIVATADSNNVSVVRLTKMPALYTWDSKTDSMTIPRHGANFDIYVELVDNTQVMIDANTLRKFAEAYLDASKASQPLKLDMFKEKSSYKTESHIEMDKSAK